MRDELGDVLLQVVFHAQMAADDGVGRRRRRRGPRREARLPPSARVRRGRGRRRRRGARELGEAQGRRGGRARPASTRTSRRRCRRSRAPRRCSVAPPAGGSSGVASTRALGALREEVDELAAAPTTGRARRGGDRRRALRGGRASRGSSVSTPRARCVGPCARSRSATSGSSTVRSRARHRRRGGRRGQSCGRCSARHGAVSGTTACRRATTSLAARSRIAPHVRRTPVLDVARRRVRGRCAAHAEARAAAGDRLVQAARGVQPHAHGRRSGDAGVVAASGGNFGLAVGHAARELGHRAEIFVPSTSPAAKIDARARDRAPTCA